MFADGVQVDPDAEMLEVFNSPDFEIEKIVSIVNYPLPVDFVVSNPDPGFEAKARLIHCRYANDDSNTLTADSTSAVETSRWNTARIELLRSGVKRTPFDLRSWRTSD